MSAIVRCPSCLQRSRVAEEALGLAVACPRCGNPFVAQSDEEPAIVPDPPIPTVHPTRRSEAPPRPAPEEHFEHHGHSGPNGFLVAVALLPLGIPLAWLLVAAITGRDTVLSFVAPLAIAVGTGGLCAGIALTHWSTATRIRAMLAAVLMAYAVSAALFFLKQGWLEEVRKNFGRGEHTWREFAPPDKAYTVKFPGPPSEQEASPVEGWSLKSFRFADPNRVGSDVFVSAHGPIPKDAEDELLYKQVENTLVTAGAVLVKTKTVATPNYQAREYEFSLPDNQIKRVVRILRIKSRVFYLSVDGPFLTGDTPDVKDFLQSFVLSK